MNIYRKCIYSLVELKELGLFTSVYRIFYEFGWRTSLFILSERFIGWFVQKYINRQSWADWQIRLNQFFFDGISAHIQRFLSNLPADSKNKIIQIADKSLQGDIYCFSSWYGKYGYPIDWNLNPRTNIKWPISVHWRNALNFSDGGDIKLVWEVNRFPHFYYLVRAYYLTGDKKYIFGYIEQIKEWSEKNPFLIGPNWASGQELAIRLFAWIFGLYAFKNENVIDEEEYKILLRQCYLHAWYINKHINFSKYAVRNNHLIGEAAALYVIGTLFPFLKDAKNWRKRGKRILEKITPSQFYPDGGYCQLSHNYHRLAVHYYLWAIRIAELNNDPVAEAYKNVIKKSANFFYQNMNLADGSLPNWGNNDGALLNPWSCCDYADFRPIVQTIAVLTGSSSPFQAGPWDEEIMWLTSDANINRKTAEQYSRSYSVCGIHILRHANNRFCVLRAGTSPDRYGQADQLHLDIFIDGYNLAVDGGSYLYNDEISFHRFFMGTGSHNTLTINNMDQMLLWRRFKWLFNTPANLLIFNAKDMVVSAEHEGYKSTQRNIVHRRKLRWEDNRIVVHDILLGDKKQEQKFTIHWQLNVNRIFHDTSDKLHTFSFQINSNDWYMYIWSITDQGIQLTDGQVHYGLNDGMMIDGWYSRYYGLKNKIFAVQISLVTDQLPNFFTVFSNQKLPMNEVLQCASC